LQSQLREEYPRTSFFSLSISKWSCLS
jgi:hypothetical protein